MGKVAIISGGARGMGAAEANFHNQVFVRMGYEDLAAEDGEFTVPLHLTSGKTAHEDGRGLDPDVPGQPDDDRDEAQEVCVAVEDHGRSLPGGHGRRVPELFGADLEEHPELLGRDVADLDSRAGDPVAYLFEFFIGPFGDALCVKYLLYHEKQKHAM